MANTSDWQDINKYFARANIDWTHRVPYDRGKSRTVLEKSISNTNSRELDLIEEVSTQVEIEDVRMSKIFQLKLKKWTHIGYQCQECNKVFSDEEIRAKHKYVCKRINTKIKQQKEDDE